MGRIEQREIDRTVLQRTFLWIIATLLREIRDLLEIHK